MSIVMEDQHEQLKLCDTGSVVSVTLNNSGEVMKGTVFAYHSDIKLLVLQQSTPTGPNNDLHLIRTDNIKDVRSSGATRPLSELALPSIDHAASCDRELRSIAAARAEAARIGVGVTREGQQIFDALAKTLPCAWRGPDILVMTEVVVAPPYDLQSCSQLVPNPSLFGRIQKVLSAERQKLGLL